MELCDGKVTFCLFCHLLHIHFTQQTHHGICVKYSVTRHGFESCNWNCSTVISISMKYPVCKIYIQFVLTSHCACTTFILSSDYLMWPSWLLNKKLARKISSCEFKKRHHEQGGFYLKTFLVEENDRELGTSVSTLIRHTALEQCICEHVSLKKITAVQHQ